MSFNRKSKIWIVLIAVSYGLALILVEDLRRPEFLLIAALSFGSELIDSGLGMGYGTILTPVLLLFLGYQPAEIVPALLASELVTGFTAAYFHNEVENIDLRWRNGRHTARALVLAAGSLVGVVVGVFAAVSLPQDTVKAAVGIVILGAGLAVLVISRIREIAYHWWKSLVVATIASFSKAISGGSYGPLVTSGQVLTGTSGRQAIAITSFAEAFTSLFALVGYVITKGSPNLLLIAALLGGSLLTPPIAAHAVSKLPETLIKTLVGSVTAIMGAVIIYKTFLG